MSRWRQSRSPAPTPSVVKVDYPGKKKESNIKKFKIESLAWEKKKNAADVV
jgi:hypothetical protein